MREQADIGYYPAISWGAIIAGVVILLVSGLMLATLGASLGLWNADLSRGMMSLKTLGAGAVIWWIITMLVSSYIGSWVSGRLAGSTLRLNAALHGIISWALAMLIAVFTAAAAAGIIFSGAVGMVAGGAQAIGGGIGQAVSGFDINKLPAPLRLEIESLFGNARQQIEGQMQKPGPSLEEAWRAFSSVLSKGPDAVTEGDREQLASIVAQRTNVSFEQARANVDKAIAGYKDFQRGLQDLGRGAQKAAEKTAETAGAAMFGGFLVQLFSLGAAALGGITGAKSSHVEPV